MIKFTVFGVREEKSREYSPHPFSELVKEFPLALIQDGQVLVPSYKGIETVVQTATLKYNQPFQSIGKREEFECEYFMDKSKEKTHIPTPTTKPTLQTPEDIFFHNLIEEYVTDKPLGCVPTNVSPTKSFFANSPLAKEKTVIITPNHYILFGGLLTNFTQDYLYQQGVTNPAKTINPSTLLNQEYAENFERATTQGKTIATYHPIFDHTHKKRFFGQSALPREITIQKSGNRYHIKTHCPKSTVKTKRGIYDFEATTLTTTVEIKEELLNLITYPHADAGYEHLFVYSSGAICYNGEKRFKQIGLTSPSTNLSNEQRHIQNPRTVNLLKKVLDEGAQNLNFGGRLATSFAIKQKTVTHRRRK